MRRDILEDAVASFFSLALDVAVKANGAVIVSLFDDLFQAIKSTAANKENVLGIDLNKFLVGVLSTTLRRNVGYRSFQDFEKCLLHTLTRNVARDRAIFALARDLVDLVDIDNAALCLFDIKIGRLNQTQKNVFYVLTDVSRFGKRGGIGNGKGYLQCFGKRLRQIRFTNTRGANEKNIAFLNVDVVILYVFFAENSLIMIVYGNA